MLSNLKMLGGVNKVIQEAAGFSSTGKAGNLLASTLEHATGAVGSLKEHAQHFTGFDMI